jgi:MscS family membrane protein
MNSDRWLAAEWNSWMNADLFLMPNWKWLALVLTILIGFVIKSLLKSVFHKTKRSDWARSRATGFMAHFLNTDLETPLAWILTGLFWRTLLDSLSVVPGLEKYLTIGIHLLLAFYIILLAYRAVEAVGRVLIDFTSKTENTLDDQLAPMATKFLKIFVVIFGFLITLQNFGVNVMSILAGLGLGGLALALAAQDTAANLFGSITILLDRPFAVGDLVKIGDTEGHVEEIGFRSTRIRTLYRSLVSIPNAIMAKEKIDNMGARPLNRIRHVFGVTYDTSEDQILSFIRETQALLEAIPEVDKQSITVKFQAMADFNLQILVLFFVRITEPARELEIQQKFLFDVMRLAKRLEIDFAFPTTTQLVKHLDAPKAAETKGSDVMTPEPQKSL